MTQDTIENLEKVFNYASLEGIDYLLELCDTQSKGDGSYQTTNFLNLFFEAILNKISDKGQNSYDKNEYIPAIFDKNLSQNNKRFIAICLLRLLNSSDKYFNDNILRLKSINLFDEVFSKDLYPIIGLHEKQQTYEKISKLKDIVSSVEIELSQLVSSCNSIESIENFRQNFLKKVNAQLSKILLSSFIQYELVDVRLKQVFNIVEEYRKEEGIKK